MKRLLIILSLFLLALPAFSQIVKGSGVLYFDSLVNVNPTLPTGAELAYSIKLRKFYYWHRTNSAWAEFDTNIQTLLTAGNLNVDVASALDRDFTLDTLNDFRLSADGFFVLEKLAGTGLMQISAAGDSINMFGQGLGAIFDSTLRFVAPDFYLNAVKLWEDPPGSAPYSLPDGLYAWFVDSLGVGQWVNRDSLGTIDGSGSAGQIAYWNNANTITGDPSLTYDGSSTITIDDGSYSGEFSNYYIAISDAGSLYDFYADPYQINNSWDDSGVSEMRKGHGYLSGTIGTNHLNGTSSSRYNQIGTDAPLIFGIVGASDDGVNSVGGELALRSSRTTSATAHGVTQSGDLLGRVTAWGNYDQTGATLDWSGKAFTSKIEFRATETYSSTARGSKIVFSTTDNTTTTVDDRLTIDQNGTVGIGQAPDGTSQLYVKRTIPSGISDESAGLFYVKDSTSSSINSLTGVSGWAESNGTGSNYLMIGVDAQAYGAGNVTYRYAVQAIAGHTGGTSDWTAGVDGYAYTNSGSGLDTLIGSTGRAHSVAGGSANIAYGLYSEIQINATGNIDTAYGVYADLKLTSDGQINVGYGLYIDDFPDGATYFTSEPWAVYVAGNERSYFGGEVRLNDITSGAATAVLGRDADGDAVGVTIGAGLSLSAGTLSATGSSYVFGSGLTETAGTVTLGGNLTADAILTDGTNSYDFGLVGIDQFSATTTDQWIFMYPTTSGIDGTYTNSPRTYHYGYTTVLDGQGYSYLYSYRTSGTGGDYAFGLDSTGVFFGSDYVNQWWRMPNTQPATASGAKSIWQPYGTGSATTAPWVRIDYGNTSGTTDGSGDLTATCVMPDNGFIVAACVIGTTFYTVQAHTKTSTSFKLRFFDAAGNAVTSTSVGADWHLIDN